jgi:hypothetical protein
MSVDSSGNEQCDRQSQSYIRLTSRQGLTATAVAEEKRPAGEAARDYGAARPSVPRSVPLKLVSTSIPSKTSIKLTLAMPKLHP